MSEPRPHDTEGPEEDVVRHYLAALDRGQVVDALSTFSMDARMRDAHGDEQRGIREIAAAFATRPRPLKVDVEEVRREGEAVAVRMRMTFPDDSDPREFRGIFRVSRERIRSLVLNPVPSSGSRRRPLARST